MKRFIYFPMGTFFYPGRFIPEYKGVFIYGIDLPGKKNVLS